MKIERYIFSLSLLFHCFLIGQEVIQNSMDSTNEDFTPFQVTDLSFNSPSDEIYPRLFQNSLIIASNKKGNGKFFDLYAVAINKDKELDSVMRKIRRGLISGYNISSPVFTSDGNTVYFTRNHFNKSNVKNKKNYIKRLYLYKGKRKGKSWRKIKKLPFIIENYSYAHPSLNKEENKLYFVADIEGGYGGTDIYYVEIAQNEVIGNPINLGPNVNTKLNETSPFITQENILIFASNGHVGFGDLDLFVIDMNIKNRVAINLGQKVNTETAEYGLILDTDSKSGYFNSGRKNNNANIYSFKSKVNLKTFADNVHKKGDSLSMHEKNQQFKLKDKNSYLEGTAENLFNDDWDNDLKTYRNNLGKIVSSIRPLLFGFDSSKITQEDEEKLNEIAQQLIKLPNLQIKIEGYTDHIGDEHYNMLLSQRRIKTVKNYLVGKGIEVEKIEVKAYGESRQLIGEELRKNRRVIIKLKK